MQKDKHIETYSYFNGKKIHKSMKLTEREEERGKKYLAEKRVTLQKVDTGYTDREEELLGIAEGIGIDHKREVPIRIVFARDRVIDTECHCMECERQYRWYYERGSKCGYTAAMLSLLEEYLSQNRLGDATDRRGSQILHSFQIYQVNQTVSSVMGSKSSLRLLPRLTQKDGELTISFKVGQEKLFVVKDLFQFYQNVRNSMTDIYGTSTSLNHHIDNFTEQGKQWISFIGNIVQEEKEFEYRLIESRIYSKKALSKNGALDLFGWRLDQFFEIGRKESIYYEEKNRQGKKKENLFCREGNPRIIMKIRKNTMDSRAQFHGVSVECDLPRLFYGTKTAYFIEGENFYRLEADFLKQVRPLLEYAGGSKLQFQIGRNKLSDFYYSVLPKIRGAIEIVEEESEEIEAYLPPEAAFVFYLDAEDGNIFCKPEVHYGEAVFSILDEEPDPAVREIAREREILFLLRQWFLYIDRKNQEMHCGKEEEAMYRVLEKGVDALLSLGDVQCTKRFTNLNITRKLKMSVGVSVAGGLLNLEISTEDLSPEELLEILESYRRKKTYHRLRNGDFVNLQDHTIEMLDEMMDSMRLKPKEFIKGRIQLPLYRTLYLDKMLEENENIYSERDSRFRNLAREFKTVKDSDFHVPESLAKVMRNYQKNGYRWLRTLETYQFGGILADDMGLGKTLQVIAVLLAAKQEAVSQTAEERDDKRFDRERMESLPSLVITPASLVFNWGEEIRKFAPGLKFGLITGTQEERKQKLSRYQEYDVLITSYDLLKRDAAFYEGKEFSYQIIDEAQYIKNHTTAAAKAVKIIQSRTRYALTGTPIENRLSELWSIFDYLMPGFLYKYEIFKKELEIPIVKNEDKKAMKRLQKMTAPFILRRLKENVLKDLPDKIEKTYYVQFEKRQQKLYDAQVIHMRQQVSAQNGEAFQKNKIQILAELMRIRQICCDPALCFENYDGESAKLEACLQLVESAVAGGHKLLLFSQFTTMLEHIQEKFTEQGISFYTITGDTPKEKRLKMVKAFNENETQVFLISLKAGGVGLNLTGADVVIHYDPWWNLAVQNQATDRAHRIGQRQKVTVYRLIAKGTVEEKIQKLQETKKDLAEQIIQGDPNRLGSMSREEFLELLEG